MKITFSVHKMQAHGVNRAQPVGVPHESSSSAVIMGPCGRTQGMFGRTKVTVLLAGWMKRKETETKDSPKFSGPSSW